LLISDFRCQISGALHSSQLSAAQWIHTEYKAQLHLFKITIPEMADAASHLEQE